MSEFREAVEEILREYRKSKVKIYPRTHEELLHIFCLDETLEEDKDDNKSILWLARNTYNKFLNKIRDNNYEKTKFGGIVDIDNLTIEFKETGKSGDGYYCKHYNEICIYIEDITTLEKDLTLRSGLIHEIAHSLSFDDGHNFERYVSPEEDREGYLMQPLELEANTIAMCDHLISQTLQIMKQYYKKENLRNTELLQSIIDQILYNIMNDEKHVYKEILDILSKDEHKFQEFYKEIIQTCIEYIQEHLDECSMYRVKNDICEQIEKTLTNNIND